MRFLQRLLPCVVALYATSVFASTYVVPPDDVLVRKAQAIVIARALHSHAQEGEHGAIETITVFALEDVLKSDGAVADQFRVSVPGGVIEPAKGDTKSKRKAKYIPGAPRFADGERILLFLDRRDDGYIVTDFALGFFAFADDDAGHRLAMRAESEIAGWNLDGSVHHEQRRDAERFLTFIRDAVAGRPAKVDSYVVETKPVAKESRSIAATSIKPAPNVVYTATQYTIPWATGTEGGSPARWATFPSAVNFNRGNNCSGATNNGSDNITTSMGMWNNDASSNINYVLTTTNSNTNGSVEAGDGVNNVVFEKNLGSAYSCAGGGLLGFGAVQTSSGTNSVNSETFDSTTEGDVSMNQGVCACVGTLGNNFNSALAHELGHTLGLRHADKSRDNSQACTNFGSYDCSSSAIMTATVTFGSSNALLAWDQRAIALIYPNGAAPSAPTNVVATAASATSVSITWTASAGATSYTVYRSSNNSTYASVGTPATNSLTDSTASANTAYMYKVTATNGNGTSGDSNKDLATTTIFTDSTLTAQSTQARTQHITELRTAVNAVRKLANGGVANDFSFTDPTLTAQSTQVKRLHIIDLRSALDPARTTLGLSALVYTDTTITAQSTKVKAAHVTELRNGVK